MFVSPSSSALCLFCCLPFLGRLVSLPFILLSATMSVDQLLGCIYVLSGLSKCWVIVILVRFSNCLIISSNRSIFLCLENWSFRYCSDVIGITIKYLLFFVANHPLSLSIKFCMLHHCGFGSPFLLLFHGSMVLYLLFELLQ